MLKTRNGDVIGTHVGADLRIFRMRDLPDVTGLSRPTLYRMLSKGLFPKPITLYGAAKGWTAEMVQNWQRERVAAEG